MVVSIIQSTLFVISSEVEKSVGYMAKKEFHTSGQLMEAIRALDYKAQYKVCAAFYRISKEIDWSDRWMFQRFEESFTMIDAENLEAHFVELHWAMNEREDIRIIMGYDVKTED